MKQKLKAKSRRRSGPRPVWQGFLKFGLVAIPVRAFAARRKEGGEPELHWVHASCHNRIHYQKVCPVHGEVDDKEIVRAYRHGKKGYVIIESDELDKLRRQRADTIDVTHVVKPAKIDAMYFTDKTYYLLPDGSAGARPYAVFQEVLDAEHRVGIAVVVLFRRERLVAVRASQSLLTMTILSHPDEYRAAADFEAQRPKAKVSAQESSLATTLLDQLAEQKFDLSSYTDPYRDELQRLIASKVSGHEIETVQEEQPPLALNFMDALKESLARAQKSDAPKRSSGSRRRKRKVS